MKKGAVKRRIKNALFCFGSTGHLDPVEERLPTSLVLLAHTIETFIVLKHLGLEIVARPFKTDERQRNHESDRGGGGRIKLQIQVLLPRLSFYRGAQERWL